MNIFTVTMNHSGNATGPASIFDPKIRVNLALDNLPVNVSDESIAKIKMLHAELLEFTPKSGDTNSSSRDPESADPEISEDLFTNDLHSGQFEFITAAAFGLDINQPIEANKVIFQMGSAALPGSLTWRYASPRVLKSLFFTPVPLTHEKETEMVTQVRCHLEYFDELMEQYVTLKIFDVSELDATIVNIKMDNQRTICASQWRLSMPGDGGVMTLDRQAAALTAFALAGSCRIDSIYSG